MAAIIAYQRPSDVLSMALIERDVRRREVHPFNKKGSLFRTRHIERITKRDHDRKESQPFVGFPKIRSSLPTAEQNEKRMRSVAEVFIFLNQESEIFESMELDRDCAGRTEKNEERDLHKTFL